MPKGMWTEGVLAPTAKSPFAPSGCRSLWHQQAVVAVQIMGGVGIRELHSGEAIVGVAGFLANMATNRGSCEVLESISVITSKQG